ncbi:hypothetical protein KHP62_03145 [Rhodobacteraceae bacterium NNCM2]|nr:hypothetical protein [Coraliihabitans acroporae]
MKYRFEVKGSAPEPYVVIIERSGDNLAASCDCPAGSKGQYCKHRFSLLAGSEEGVIGGDRHAIASLPSLLEGTDVARAIAALAAAEKDLVAAKKRVSEAKKGIAAAMRS